MRARWPPASADLGSAEPEGDAGDEFASEAVLEPFEDFALPVADDLGQPDAAVHGDEQRALAESGRPGMGGDAGVHHLIPGLQYGHGRVTLGEGESLNELGDQIAGLALRRTGSLFQWFEIHSPPFRQHGIATVPAAGGAWPNGSRSGS